jgi:hypothetical protein
MIGGTGSAYDYVYIQEYLSDRLLRGLWDLGVRKAFVDEFVEAPFPVDSSKRPVVGIGIGTGENREQSRLEFLSTIDGKYLQIEKLLSENKLDGIDFTVIKTGRIMAASIKAQGGDPIKRRGGPQGTFGCLVEEAKTFGSEYILSCHHVLASLNKGEKMKDEILYPTSTASSENGSRIGVLWESARIDLGPQANNIVDAALCKPDDVLMVDPGIRHLGPVSGYVASPDFGLRVRKEGAATGVTIGVIRLKNISTIVTYDTGEEALFMGQLGIFGAEGVAHFARQGDSGALVINENNSAVGLLFAVSEDVDLAYANPIEPVFQKLGVALSKRKRK